MERIIPGLSDNALQVLEKKYLRGETPSDMFARVAHAAIIGEGGINYNAASPAYIEAHDRMLEQEDKFYNLMASLDFLPNSPTLMNAGRPLAQLAACFVLPIIDSMEGIGEAMKQMGLIQKTGGGTGFSFSSLRPAGAAVSTTMGGSSGPLSFMTAFNAYTETIKQGGARRGANMAIMRVDHPDILEFIKAKSDLTKLTNFNMSVGITDEFMHCLFTNTPMQLRFPNSATDYGTVKPLEVMRLIVERAWTTGEPGVVFLDEINRFNPTPLLGEMDSTNPCGEQPLLPFEACNLGSINLANMLMMQHGRWVVDVEKLKYTVTEAVRFLDNVIDVNNYPLPEIEAMCKANRKIGLGVMGFADMLYKMEVPYDSDDALEVAENTMQIIQIAAHLASRKLTEERGSFPNWDKSTWKQKGKIRNATATTIAPTGTISIIAGVSSGIEPVFALAFNKNLVEGGVLTMYNHTFVGHLMDRGYSSIEIDNILKEVVETGSIQNSQLIKHADTKWIFKTASEINPKSHVRMQAAFQKHVDNAVSKTINFKSDTSKDEIMDAILLAHKLKCKGLTVYRDGSRDSQPLTTGGKTDGIANQNISRKSNIRPKRLTGITEQLETGCGRMFLTVNYSEGKIYETFLKAGVSGGCAAFTEGTGRLISIALRYGVPLEEIIGQLKSVRCDNFRYQAGKNPQLKGKSCPDAIGKLLEQLTAVTVDMVPMEEMASTIESRPVRLIETMQDWLAQGLCPECHEPINRAEGCIVCECGFSKC